MGCSTTDPLLDMMAEAIARERRMFGPEISRRLPQMWRDLAMLVYGPANQSRDFDIDAEITRIMREAGFPCDDGGPANDGVK